MIEIKMPEEVTQEPCDDCISREAVDEYITNLLSGYLYDEERTRLEDLTAYIWELPSVQPCEDCVSRKLLSDNICEGISCNECSFNEIDGESGCLLQKRFDELPSVQPIRPTGKWIDIGNEGLVFKCSICGTKKTIESHYCPNCGARMEAET